jgi:glutaredoxin 3
MAKVDLYVTLGCPFCQKAMAWMSEYEVEHNLTVFKTTQEKMLFYANNPGVTTVPQIFIDGKRIGGWSDLCKHEFKTTTEEEFKRNKFIDDEDASHQQ